jgi:pimeloyl-ACP methyl ester carboxylesterase
LLTTSYEVVDGKRLRVAHLGHGMPLLLLHGYPDTLQIWSELAPRLAARFHVIAFDWPGLGESEPWSGGASPYDLGRRVLRLLDHWGFPRAILAAHDMGGQAALAAAVVAPERVQSLAVMNSLVIPEARTSWEIALLRRFKVNRWLLRRMPRSVFRRAVDTSIDRLPPELRAELWQHFQRQAPRDFLIRMCAGYEGTLPRLAASYELITAPTLILWGERDTHFPPIHAYRLHQRIAGSALRILPGARHWMAVDRAEEVAAEILIAAV